MQIHKTVRKKTLFGKIEVREQNRYPSITFTVISRYGR